MGCQGTDQDKFLDRMEYVSLAVIGLFILIESIMAVGTTVVICKRKSH